MQIDFCRKISQDSHLHFIANFCITRLGMGRYHFFLSDTITDISPATVADGQDLQTPILKCLQSHKVYISWM